MDYWRGLQLEGKSTAKPPPCSDRLTSAADWTGLATEEVVVDLGTVVGVVVVVDRGGGDVDVGEARLLVSPPFTATIVPATIATIATRPATTIATAGVETP